ncbi:uncharacterized protein K460DRAFT_108923 [Cucurbitaria berberidis CBS 394.84]|uniref:Uncharacterized protein n=1 Tax=Cucurbitaria berberidis CBS 394.84 TaxID=1168544 RepID=A0A9P4GH91_9PLEO|nr:uncharacterized protein K460DRAFT_108923 [Cucurbitaria berberidis CBS 394.84]KAF1845429.1 hypothetical protein K460DRAFT_108923 [Cucurbitaria berberidis CBS 394.84]
MDKDSRLSKRQNATDEGCDDEGKIFRANAKRRGLVNDLLRGSFCSKSAGGSGIGSVMAARLRHRTRPGEIVPPAVRRLFRIGHTYNVSLASIALFSFCDMVVVVRDFAKNVGTTSERAAVFLLISTDKGCEHGCSAVVLVTVAAMMRPTQGSTSSPPRRPPQPLRSPYRFATFQTRLTYFPGRATAVNDVERTRMTHPLPSRNIGTIGTSFLRTRKKRLPEARRGGVMKKSVPDRRDRHGLRPNEACCWAG